MVAIRGRHPAWRSEAQGAARPWCALLAAAAHLCTAGAAFADEYDPTLEWMQTGGFQPIGPYATALLACQSGNSSRQDIALRNPSWDGVHYSGYWCWRLAWMPPSYYANDHWIGTKATLVHKCTYGGTFNWTKHKCVTSGCTGGTVLQNGACVVPPPDKAPPSCGAGSASPGDSSAGGATPPYIQSTCGDPIAFDRGRVIETETDYRASGASALRFSRFYDSQSPYTTQTAGARPLGNRWRHNYDVSISLQASLNKVLVVRGDGRILHFSPLAGSSTEWVSDADVNESLTKTATGWQYRTEDQATEDYDYTGRLQRRTDRTGMSLSFAYNAGGLLAQVTDSFGRSLGFEYDNAKRLLTTLTDPAGQVIRYSYSSSGDLTSVTYPDGTSRRYGYSVLLSGGVVTQRTLLSSLTDEAGTVTSTWQYSTTGLAVSNQRAGGVEKYGLAYTQDAAGLITAVTMTNPLNAQTRFSLQSILGVSRPVSETHPLVPGAVRTQAFDGNGNRVRHTDFDGTVTTFEYDLARNLETRRIEAAGTATARTTSTEWHPIWRRPTAVATAGRITRYEYDPAGNRMRLTEQSTSDASGSAGFAATALGEARTWTYSYDPYGQVLTEDGPRTDVADLTTYEYWPADATCPGEGEGTGMDKGCRGQLKRMTNAAGHITDYLQYNAHGQLMLGRAADGIEHAFTYDARRRLTSRSEGGRTTSYQYDPRGLLTRITAPDGSYLDYTYDDAHRLIGIGDAAGNTIAYTLDAAGNRVDEAAKDAGGVLRQAVARELDALSRIKTETLGPFQ